MFIIPAATWMIIWRAVDDIGPRPIYPNFSSSEYGNPLINRTLPYVSSHIVSFQSKYFQHNKMGNLKVEVTKHVVGGRCVWCLYKEHKCFFVGVGLPYAFS